MNISPSSHSCSTFLFDPGDNCFVGHNLDDYIETPGLILVNPRGAEKQNISWAEISPEWTMLSFYRPALPKIHWTSRYGSITYNTAGKEFIDGGLNEAGLYVGEMTLLGTRFPRDNALPKFYHHQWMQYLLDNFATVSQVLENLDKALIDGHCQWHFFIADRGGDSATIEFLEGKTQVYHGASLPFKHLCNASYPNELKKVARFQGFGGEEAIDYQKFEGWMRFVWAADMFKSYQANPSEPALDYAFKVLEQIKGDNNKWRLLFDLKNFRVYFATYKAPRYRYVDFSAFDFSPGAPPLALDIHRDLEGDVANQFAPYTLEDARTHIFWDHIQAPGPFGWILRTFIIPNIKKRMAAFSA